ncbi:MAG: acyl-CoA dehydrogenase family protein [Rhodobiaceae bacterium]|nr:acyl-CoA dehydrogenase family protein [Rhodobiaceae bacterium]MCC0041692.1 acyl-CoA dehydrogenase family protein [Rhodobiaceae bacterium]
MSDLFHMLAEEERAFIDVLERFAAETLAPKAAAIDESATFVSEQIAGLGELGMMGANLPEQWGGSGISAQCLLRAVEIVAGACGSTASALTAHYLATDSILIGGSDEQRAAYLPKAASGEALGAFALTEPKAGSDPADMRTRAVRSDAGWRLIGNKCFISNGGVADFIVVYAVTDPDAGHRGISAFVVDGDTPGLTRGKAERTMGLRGGHVFELAFNCEVPADRLLGSEGSGFRTAMKVLDNGRVEVAAMCIGIAAQALKLATEWAKERIVGGEPIADKQGIRWMLADMALDLRASRLLALEAARQRELGERFSEAAAMAKLHASEMAGRVTDAALQVHGGYGFTRDFPLERLVRDVRIMRIYEGSSEIQRNIISGHLLA